MTGLRILEGMRASPDGPARGRRSTVALVVLALLLAGDVALVVLHLPQVVDMTDVVEALPAWAERIVFDRDWWLEEDGGHAERFGYAKSAAAVGLAGLSYVRTRQAVYGAWGATYLVILLDDSLQLHERGGTFLADAGVPGVGLGASNVGELLVWALLGLPLLTAVVVTHISSDGTARATSGALGVLTAVLVGLAVVVDAVHVRLTGTPAWIVGTIEDGGELVVVTFVVATLILALPGRREEGDRDSQPVGIRPVVTSCR